MLSSTTLQVAFNKTSPEPTKDRLRITNRKKNNKTKKRVRFEIRTGYPNTPHKNTLSNNYKASAYKNGKTITRKPSIKQKGASSKPQKTKTKTSVPLWLMYTIIIVVIVVVFGLVAYPLTSSPNGGFTVRSINLAPVAKESISASAPKPIGDFHMHPVGDVFDVFGG